MKIRDIRFYESGERDGTRFSDEVGKLFAFPHKIAWMGECVARKLRESDFSLGEFDHLCINFCDYLPDGRIELLSESAEPWYRVCNYGVSAALFAAMQPAERYALAVRAVEGILTFLRPENAAEIAAACACVGWEADWCDIVYLQTSNRYGRAQLILRYFADSRPGRSATASLYLRDYDAAGLLKREEEIVPRRELYRTLRHTGSLVLQKGRIRVKGKVVSGSPQAETIERKR